MQGLVCDIQRFCVSDGPGIRTTVFLQGCSLVCAWCHNPEAIPRQSVPRKREGREPVPSSRPMDTGEVLSVVLEDKPFFDASGGGMTLSGGEPLAQAAYSGELLRGAKDVGVRTAVETAGFAPWNALETILPHTDLFLYDYKVTQDTRRFIGADNRLILQNLSRLSAAGAAILLRCPIIPGVNDNVAHLKAIGKIARENRGVMGVEMLAYHRLGVSKYREIGREYTMGHLEPWDEERKQAFLGQAMQFIQSQVKWG